MREITITRDTMLGDILDTCTFETEKNVLRSIQEVFGITISREKGDDFKVLTSLSLAEIAEQAGKPKEVGVLIATLNNLFILEAAAQK